MSSQEPLKAATCIACRMRRKKCDRKEPICSSCEELNIPKNLCVCPRGKLGLKSKNSKVTRDTLIQSNHNLREEQKYLQSLINGDPVTPDVRMKLSQILNSEQKSKKHERNLFLTQRTDNGYFGSSSWKATVGTTPPGAQFVAEINKLLRHAKIDYEKKNGTLGRTSQFPQLNGFRSKVTEACLGIKDHDMSQLTMQLLKEIEKILPSYNQTLDLIKRYFFINQMRKIGFIGLDEYEFYKSFNSIVGQDPDGKVQFNATLPGEEYKIPFIFLFTTMMTAMVFQLNQTYTHANAFNHMLIHEHADVLYHLSLLATKSKQKSPSVIVQYDQFEFKLLIQIIQGLVHYNVFDRYFPHGRLVELEDDTMGHSLAVKRLLTLMKGMKLNTDIDKTFHYFTKPYRESLQSLWLFLAYLDAGEAFESGTMPKCDPHDLTSKINPSREKYRESIYVFNMTLKRLSKHETEDPIKVVNLISEKLVPDIKKLLKAQYMPTGETMYYLENFDMDNLSNRQSFFELTETYSIQLTLLSLIQTLFNICAKRLEEHQRFSPLHKQYGLLTLKYGLLIFYSVPAFLKCLQRVSTHKNSIVFGILPAFFGTFPHIRLAFRRSMYFVGCRVFDNFPVDKKTLLESIYQKHEKSDEELMREILARQNFQHFYTFEDLEEFDIDMDQTALLNKFTALNNYTYLILSMGKAFVELQNCLKTQYVNLSFVRLSPTFFKTMKICSVFLNNAFSNSEPQQIPVPAAQYQFQQQPQPQQPVPPLNQGLSPHPPHPPPQFSVQIPSLGQHNIPPVPLSSKSNYNQNFESIPLPQQPGPTAPPLQQIPQMQAPIIPGLQTQQFNQQPFPIIPSEAAQPPTSSTPTSNSSNFNVSNISGGSVGIDQTGSGAGEFWKTEPEEPSVQPEFMDFESFFNTPGLYHSGNLEEFLSVIPRPPSY